MRKSLSALLLCLCGSIATHAQQSVSLAGVWDFSLQDSTRYSDYIHLPGSMLTNGKGTPVSVKTQWTGSLYDSSYYHNPYMEKYRIGKPLAGKASGKSPIKFPFFLTPEYHYVGVAWYHKSVFVPKGWEGQRISLFLERPHIETTVFVNGVEAGHQMSLSTPHVYDLTSLVKAGCQNDITIRVYNGIENVCVGQDSHSVTDQTQGNWNGIVGRMELQCRPGQLSIRAVRVYPYVSNKKAHVALSLNLPVNNQEDNSLQSIFDSTPLRYELKYDGQRDAVHVVSPKYSCEEKDGKQLVSFDIPMDKEMREWDEFSPVIYRLRIFAGDDTYETSFGMRDITVRGRGLFINGRPLYLRGTVENCCFPATGYPPTDESEWLRIFRKCKEYGLNHVRFHSYCPPEAAFNAADRVGIYLQPEGPSWPNHGVKLRRGMYIDQYLLDESKRIVDTYGNHPSFLMMAAGNEPAGDWVSYCNQWVKEMKSYDSTKIYAGASVGGGWAWDSESEFHVKGGARGLDNWNRRLPSSDDDYFSGIEFPRNYKSDTPNQSPIITHEKGQWCAFPDFNEISQYNGVYKARNFEIFRDLLRDHGMDGMGSKFLHASGKLQTLCYKYEIERNLRTKDYAGFQLLGLNDYSGQGTALVGVLNVFWREKGYCTSDDWREFCSPTVPLARFPKFVFTDTDTLSVPIEAYNALPHSLTGLKPSYTITDSEAHIIASGDFGGMDLSVGKNNPVGKVVFPLNSIKEASKLTLTVNLTDDIKNHWNFWVYPSLTPGDKQMMEKSRKGILISDTIDDKVLRVLEKGGTVLLTAAGHVTYGNDVKQNYLPVFWNTSWFKMRPPHTTGAYIDTSHPLFKQDFPTDDWGNLNWWGLLNRAQVMNLAEFPTSYQSPIQPIDTWHVSRKLGMLVEARILNGRLLMTTMDISSDLEHRPVALQMRKAILKYMQSSDFHPSFTLEAECIKNLYTKESAKVDMYTNESPDELKPQLK